MSAAPTSLPHAPASSRTLVAAAASAVRRRILDGTLAVGDRIPPERALMGDLGVSRTVLREALTRLEALGLIETRGSRGRFVAAAGSSRRSDELVHAWLFHNGAEISECDDVRALLESQAIRRTAGEHLAAVVRRATVVLDEQRSASLRGDTLRAAELDGEFHRTLTSGCQNAMLRSLIDGLIDHMHRATIAVYAYPGAAERSVADHAAIVELLDAGDAHGAAERTATHHQRVAHELAGTPALS